MRKYRVICDWTDLTSGERDADEISVYAKSASAAVGKARRLWRETKGVEWPRTRLDHAYVLTRKKLMELV